ncbi:MAG TPA: threonine ammonia-lyase [Candidatus Coprocola pullicola]|nr:threonine ammonia-lyase [Candidatus Coprocola pullicola]
MVTLEMIKDAKEVLKKVARSTPVISAPKIGENVSIKAENLQLTGSFKLRGAYYKISSLTPEEKAKGVIACSAGNHAQGVALSATKNGIKSTICIPAGAPLSKVEATRGYGGDVVLVPGVYDDAYAKAVELTEKNGYTFVHPFNDEKVIAGQGTIGLEILEQEPDVEAVFVPIGGGGLISGVACAIKSVKPECKVYGVQAAGAPSMFDSINKGEIIELANVSTIADGIAVKKPGDLTFEMCQKYVDGIVTVTEDEIATAILALMEMQKTVSEGAGATSVAAVMFDKVPEVKGKNIVCIVSGGNIDVSILSRVITKGLTKTGRITEVTTKVVDKPGQLIHLLQLVSDVGANIISIDHQREDKKSEINSCIVSMVLETRNIMHSEELCKTLQDNGYEIFES